MATPSLSEITSIKGDADLAYGTAGVGGNDTVLNWNPAIAFLSDAAKEKARADQFKIQLYQKNIDDYYRNFREVDVNGMMPGDYTDIGADYANLANEMASNMDVIRNPMLNQRKYAELQTREAELRRKIAQSKMDLGRIRLHQDNIRQHPDLNTEVNNQVVQRFYGAKLGERGEPELVTPTVYDPVARAKVANQVAQQNLVTEQAKGRYIVKEEATRYLEGEYDKAWDALGSQDRNGRTIFDAAIDAYKRLPATYTSGKDWQQIDREVGRSLMMQDQTARSIKEDPVAAQEDAQQHDAAMEALRHRNRLGEMSEQYGLMLRNQQAKLQVKEGDAELLNTVTAKAFLDPAGMTRRTVFDKSKNKSVEIDVVPLSQTELQALARQQEGLDGKRFMQAPAFVERGKDGTLLAHFDTGDGKTFEAGQRYTPDKFRREFATLYFADKEVPQLLKKADEAFAEATNRGTMDNVDAMKTWLTSRNAWSNQTQNQVNQRKVVIDPANPVAPPDATKPSSSETLHITTRKRYNPATGQFE